MNNIWTMTLFTLREAMARKVFIFFTGVTVIVLIIQALLFSLFNVAELMPVVDSSGEQFMVQTIVSRLELMIVAPLGGLCLLLSIFSASSFIPSMLEKGNIDLLLSKPVTRTQLLLGKYLGGILVVFINIALLIFGVWLITAIKFNYWDPSFLLVALPITFTFAVLYSIIVLMGVITQSSISGMMLSYFIFLILSPLLFAAKDKFSVAIENGTVKDIIIGAYYFFPKTSQLMGDVLIKLTLGEGITDFQPIITSLVFLILVMIFSILLFRKKDF